MMKDEKRLTEKNIKHAGVLAPFAGVFLLIASLFGLAAIVAFGALGAGSEAGWSFVIGAVLCWIGWFLAKRQAGKSGRIASDKYSRQRALLAVNSFASVLLVLVLVVGANYVASRRHRVFDLTRNRINSLSDQTRKTLGEIKTPLDFIYVWAPTEQMPQPDPAVQSVLDAYKSASEKINIEYFNAYQDPFRFRQLRLNTFSGQPLLIIEPRRAKGSELSTVAASRQEVAVADESNITSAILKITDPKPRALYFLTGHGESLPAATNAGVGASTRVAAASAALRAQNYTLQNLLLLGAKSSIPDDVQAVIVLAPQVDITAGEAMKFKKYVAGKGRLVLLFDATGTAFPHWQSVLSALNLEVSDGVVSEFDRRYFLQRPNFVIAPLQTARHPLLRGVNADMVFPNALPLKMVSPTKAPGAAQIAPLLITSGKSQVAFFRNQQLVQGPRGPFVIAAAVAKAGGLRAVVAGNAAFCSDDWFNQLGNASFFLSSINWVAGNDVLVSIPPKAPVTNSITMNAATQRFALLFALLVMPVLALFVGTVTWWKRR
jgi:ABC-2 type transport system permease protein